MDENLILKLNKIQQKGTFSIYVNKVKNDLGNIESKKEKPVANLKKQM